jgi:hypothetical protein
MNKTAWTQPRNTEEANRRAGGRRRYNAVRKKIAESRLLPLAHELAAIGELEGVIGVGKQTPVRRGFISAVAKRLGVHRTTAWRDVQRLRDRRHWCWSQSRDGKVVTVRLYGLGKVVYTQNGFW